VIHIVNEHHQTLFTSATKTTREAMEETKYFFDKLLTGKSTNPPQTYRILAATGTVPGFATIGNQAEADTATAED